MVYQNSLPSAVTPFSSPSRASHGYSETWNIPGFWTNLKFWIYESVEYARITQGSDVPEYA